METPETRLPRHSKITRLALSLAALVLLVGGPAQAANMTCRDPQLPPTYPADRPVTNVTPQVNAVRFLNTATFGASPRDLQHLTGMTPSEWIDEQIALDASCHLPSLNQSQENNSRENRVEVWWRHAVTAPDQLRQRVAFALSQIFVVSDVNSSLSQNGMAAYYDILLDNAFGNFRDLLEDVTLSPVMGRYLSMLGNQKANRKAGIRADENYAREIMQLFSVGLVQLNPGGRPVLVDGKTVPTYSQADVENLARVFTGWTWGDSLFFDDWQGNDWRLPMRVFPKYHDSGEKVIIGGTVIPAGGTPQQDLALALDTLFNHPNTGTFIGKQLIQRLVTSNPSPAYVARVAAKFADNGKGVRGDMRAVIRAILLDREALGSVDVNTDFGKLREPVMTMTHLWRAFGATTADGHFYYQRWDNALGQAPLSAPSVFNFYRPNYSPPGPLRAAGKVGPEFQLVNDATTGALQNELYWRINYYRQDLDWAYRNDILINIASLTKRAGNPTTLVTYLDLMLTGNRLPAEFKQTLIDYLGTVNGNTWDRRGVNARRSVDALYLVMGSPYYLIQY